MRGREILDDWKFSLDKVDGPHLPKTNDQEWRSVDLPHDWSVEFDFDPTLGEACTAYLLGGKGWYRKHFITSEEMIDQDVIINFDGIYSRATVYCNGELLKFHPYGYSPLVLNISQYLNKVGEDNVIAVHVDHSRYADSRWYTGSGIYRKVSLHVVPKIHIPVWGVKIEVLQASVEKAVITCSVELEGRDLDYDHGSLLLNGREITQDYSIRIEVYNPEDELMYKSVEEIGKFEIDLKAPEQWRIHEGKQYKLLTYLIYDNEVVQLKSERFGLRTFEFHKEKGFFFNGEATLIKGVCLHHEAGLVGAAVPGDVWRRRLRTLKECGCNAIRTAHNPFSEDFLDICDEMGFLVQEEFFDEWDHPKDKRQNTHERTIDYITRSYTEYFRDYAQNDLQTTIRRDWNHPCIIQWSIGNEIEWTYPKYKKACGFFSDDALGYAFWRKPPYSKEEIIKRINKIAKDEYDIGSTAKKLSDWTKEMDRTRPVMANCILPSLSYENGYIDALDMVGYSYRHVMYDYGHQHYPDTPITGTENKGQWHEWEAVLERDYIPGVFLWMGIDHMGEAWVEKSWPRKGSNLGLLDLAGFKRPAYYMFKALWNNEPSIKVFSQTRDKSLFEPHSDGTYSYKSQGGYKRRSWYWQDVNDHWNYKSNEEVIVEVYSNMAAVELFINDRSLGVKYLKDFEDRIYKWRLNYEEGCIRAEGVVDEIVYADSLITSGEVSGIRLETDKDIIEIKGDCVAHIEVRIEDSSGTWIHNQEVDIEFTYSNNLRNLGVDNGHADNVQKFQNNHIRSSNGRCLMIVQGLEPGDAIIKAHVVGSELLFATIAIKVQ